MADRNTLDAAHLEPEPVRGRRCPNAPEDADLVTRLAAGDAHALAPLYDRHGGPAYSLAHRICGDQRLAEDVIVQVFGSLR